MECCERAEGLCADCQSQVDYFRLREIRDEVIAVAQAAADAPVREG